MNYTKSELATMRFCAEETGVTLKALKDAVTRILEREKEEIKNVKSVYELNRDELERLRGEICLGSMYYSDYENSFGIDDHQVCTFFDGYLDFLHEENGVDIDDELDNTEMLERWQNCFSMSEEELEEARAPMVNAIREKYEEKRQEIFDEEEIYSIAHAIQWGTLKKYGIAA